MSLGSEEARASGKWHYLTDIGGTVEPKNGSPGWSQPSSTLLPLALRESFTGTGRALLRVAKALSGSSPFTGDGGRYIVTLPTVEYDIVGADDVDECAVPDRCGPDAHCANQLGPRCPNGDGWDSELAGSGALQVFSSARAILDCEGFRP